jgi:dTDP-4-amino-4,6-dideoxygalactose transaminase
MKPRYYHSEVGINSRLDAIQAAVLNVKLPRLDHWTASRQRNARVYNELFRSHGLDQFVTLPTGRGSVRHVWNQYTIRVHNGLRDGLRSHLQNAGIGTEIYYPIPLHRQACFQSLGYTDGSLPETERASREVMSLPVFPGMNQAELESVVQQVRSFFHSKPPIATLSPSLHSSTTTVQR